MAAIGGALALVGVIWGGFRAFSRDIGGVALKADVGEELKKHNESDKSHPDVRNAVHGMNEVDSILQSKIGMSKADIVTLGSQIVYLRAFNNEPRPTFKDAAGQFYERVYNRLVQRNVSVKDAISEALDTPWPHRKK